jgi:hypothetical protein
MACDVVMPRKAKRIQTVSRGCKHNHRGPACFTDEEEL